MTNDTAFSIRPVVNGGGVRDWLKVPHEIFAGDQAWVAPLHMQERQRISSRHNPFFKFGEAAFFVAYSGNHPVGRISAQINRRHLSQHSDDTGHFGFFDCIDEQAIANALVSTAVSWLKGRGLHHMRGPFNLSINEDIGLLVSGFDTPPAILTSHAPPWAGRLLEGCGLTKEMDLFAYRMSPKSAPDYIVRLAKLATDSGRVRIRPFDMANYARELELIFDIFNDAWSDNWGFVPFSSHEVAVLIKDTRPIMRSKFGRVVEIDGQPAAMMVALPDLNSVIAPFNGKLMPVNWAKLGYAIWADHWKTARIPLLGVRKQFRATPIAPAVLSLLVSEFLALGRAYDLEWVEFSWVLETNRQMVKLAETAAGRPSKVYRVYGMPLK